ncbi:UNVERIFIED_CONTAM: hypothetical protein Scaly_3014400 [Sesamum calycinum]|uniref:Retrotransposon gag domain-containing protein n=1 Tax=Sesamum calycinum TaxID=2727403 RepID=A0AAW2KFS3_9LAMI
MRHGVKLSKKQSPKTDEALKRMLDVPYASAIGSIQVVAWKSSKRDITSDSTTEAEYIEASEAAKEAVWMKNYIQELGEGIHTLQIQGKNKSKNILPRRSSRPTRLEICANKSLPLIPSIYIRTQDASSKHSMAPRRNQVVMIEKNVINSTTAVEEQTRANQCWRVKPQPLICSKHTGKEKQADEEPPLIESVQKSSHSATSIAALTVQQLQEMIDNTIKAQYRGSTQNSPAYSKPYSKQIDTLRMPIGYQPPKLQQFDGKGNLKQHIAHFIETCNNADTDNDLLVKQFVRSLKGNAFDWYVDLEPDSIDSWDEMEREFLNRFYSTRRTVLSPLHFVSGSVHDETSILRPSQEGHTTTKGCGDFVLAKFPQKKWRSKQSL